MRFLLDQGIPQSVAAHLSAQGFDAVHVHSLRMRAIGCADEGGASTSDTDDAPFDSAQDRLRTSAHPMALSFTINWVCIKPSIRP